MNFLQTNISLYIPHVYSNYTSERIADVFENKLKIGVIKSIDLVAKLGKNNVSYNAVYIHFENWYNTEAARDLQKKVLGAVPNEQVKLFYDQPWYWIVLENKSKKVIPGERKQRIVLDDFAEEVKIPTTVENLNQDQDNDLVSFEEFEDFEEFEEFEVSTMDEMIEENVDQCVIDFIENIENELEEDDDVLITIDGRYVRELEEEIMLLRSTMLPQQQYYQVPPPPPLYSYQVPQPYYYPVVYPPMY